MKLIPVHSRQGIIAYTMVDDRDYVWLSSWRWNNRAGTRKGKPRMYVGRAIYPSKGKQQIIMMHRLILGLQYGDRRQGDHIDGNPLNNQRSNLRVATNSQNSQNQRSPQGKSSSYRGVSWHNQHNKWSAYARLDGRQYHLGYFDTEKEAATASLAWRLSNMPFTKER